MIHAVLIIFFLLVVVVVVVVVAVAVVFVVVVARAGFFPVDLAMNSVRLCNSMFVKNQTLIQPV